MDVFFFLFLFLLTLREDSEMSTTDLKSKFQKSSLQICFSVLLFCALFTGKIKPCYLHVEERHGKLKGWTGPPWYIIEIAHLVSVTIYERCQCWGCVAVTPSLHALRQDKKIQMWLLVQRCSSSSVCFHRNSLWDSILRMGIAMVCQQCWNVVCLQAMSPLYHLWAERKA